MNVATYLERLERGLASVSRQMPRILEDPRAYPRETMVLALIAAIAVLMLIMFVVLVVEWARDRSVRRAVRLRRRPRDVRLRLGVAAAVAALLIALLALVPLVPAAGAACGACHATAPAVESWRAGSHASVSCYGCHARPGALGAFEALAHGAGVAFAGESALPVDSRGCLSCHSVVRSGVAEVGGMSVRHAEIIAAGIECTRCHADIGHAEKPAAAATAAETPTATAAAATAAAATPGGTARTAARSVTRPTMSVCLGCHDGTTASAECDVCHTGSSPSDVSVASGPNGTTRATVTCVGCHQKSTDARCIDCHGLVMPHPATFMREHAGRSWEDPSLCASCHEAAVARDGCGCHSDVNVHGTYTEWFPQHITAARTNGEAGCGCHGLASCARCHTSNPWQ